LPPGSTTVHEDIFLQRHDAAVLAIALQIVTANPKNVAEMQPSFFQTAREATRSASVHSDDTDDPAQSETRELNDRCRITCYNVTWILTYVKSSDRHDLMNNP
jgi:hypothetical protein